MALDHLEACDVTAAQDVMVPFYKSFWRKVLFEAKMFEEVVKITGRLLEAAPDSGSVLFDRAYGFSEVGKPAEAEAAYKALIAREPKNPNAMHNLSILLEGRDLLEEALGLSDGAAKLAPGDQLITERAAQLEKRIEPHRRELQRREQFLSTAPVQLRCPLEVVLPRGMYQLDKQLGGNVGEGAYGAVGSHEQAGQYQVLPTREHREVGSHALDLPLHVYGMAVLSDGIYQSSHVRALGGYPCNE